MTRPTEMIATLAVVGPSRNSSVNEITVFWLFKLVLGEKPFFQRG
jgi:hypothetical protein